MQAKQSDICQSYNSEANLLQIKNNQRLLAERCGIFFGYKNMFSSHCVA